MVKPPRGKMLVRVPGVMCCGMCLAVGTEDMERAPTERADFPAQVAWGMGRTFLRWGALGECQLGARKRAE